MFQPDTSLIRRLYYEVHLYLRRLIKRTSLKNYIVKVIISLFHNISSMDNPSLYSAKWPLALRCSLLRTFKK
uniref:Uncharacterized protein n=1 Tax=Octopus bimaculoides TaxID=37653 RepID=A0A0L8GRP9_OCTBM